MSNIENLNKLREPFPANQISKLPKPTKQQTEEVRNNFQTGVRCKECGGWHHPNVIHLDYVGHAAITDRLLDADPEWYWEPLSFNEKGQPVCDSIGGMWIKLTVCGVTRLGYGNAAGKTGGDAIKEVIGDALRNAAMRFGAALELWHKGELHIDDEATEPARQKTTVKKDAPVNISQAEEIKFPSDWILEMRNAKTMEELAEIFTAAKKQMHNQPKIISELVKAKDECKASLNNEEAA